jgi:hypothetical protein
MTETSTACPEVLKLLTVKEKASIEKDEDKKKEEKCIQLVRTSGASDRSSESLNIVLFIRGILV